MQENNLLLVAKIGKTHGFSGGLKLHILSDFPHIFKPDSVFFTQNNENLVISRFQSDKSIVFFQGFDSKESAARLVNTELFSTMEQSKKLCNLASGEFLWAELIGVKVIESRQILGLVSDIERISGLDYFVISTDSRLIQNGLPKTFLIPNIKQYVLDISLQGIFTQNAMGILENS